tara:strand:+ start:1824 stop:2018 length:195 start_codon:yes stop_codon:yes gene_type:complete
MKHLKTEFIIHKDQITYWFKDQGKILGLRTERGIELVVNHVEQKVTCLSSYLMDKLREAKELVK